MGKRELIAREPDHLPEQDLDRLLMFLRSLKESHAATAVPALAAESALVKGLAHTGEDAAWANL